MFALMKLLPLVGLFKDVTEQVKEAGIEKRPWYLQRTVIGSILALIAGIAASFLGVTLDTKMLDSLSDNIPQMITIIITVYGTLLSAFGAIMKVVKANKAAPTQGDAK